MKNFYSWICTIFEIIVVKIVRLLYIFLALFKSRVYFVKRGLVIVNPHILLSLLLRKFTKLSMCIQSFKDPSVFEMPKVNNFLVRSILVVVYLLVAFSLKCENTLFYLEHQYITISQCMRPHDSKG